MAEGNDLFGARLDQEEGVADPTGHLVRVHSL